MKESKQPLKTRKASRKSKETFSSRASRRNSALLVPQVGDSGLQNHNKCAMLSYEICSYKSKRKLIQKCMVSFFLANNMHIYFLSKSLEEVSQSMDLRF